MHINKITSRGIQIKASDTFGQKMYGPSLSKRARCLYIDTYVGKCMHAMHIYIWVYLLCVIVTFRLRPPIFLEGADEHTPNPLLHEVRYKYIYRYMCI